MSSLLRSLTTNPSVFGRLCRTKFNIHTFTVCLSSCHVIISEKVNKCASLTSVARQFSYSSERKKANSPLKLITIPNIITLSRIILTPFIVYTIVNGEFREALILIALSGISDALDGFVARRFDQKSLIGSIMDPLADKILVTSLVISMTYVDIYPISLMILVLLRDISIIGIASHVVYLSIPLPRSFSSLLMGKYSLIEMKASYLSKLNTFCQLSSIVFSVSHVLHNFPDIHYLMAIWFITAGTTLTSGFGYLRQLPSWKEKAIQASKEQSQNNRT